MKLRMVHAFPVFWITCTKCGEKKWTDKAIVWADLDGPSFNSYYCNVCKNVVEQDQEKS